MKRITINKRVAFLSAAMAVVGCASVQPTSDDDVRQELRASFQERGMAKIERLDQTELQRVCSAAATTGQPLDAATRARLEKAALDTVKYPADNQYLGDWKQGERIAQTGVG
ncbi:MAG TPA: sulfur oxidation c-type cytochrome SoxX, partial [Burkholderiaceae bacterium]|nr:sulfur oxidation c-type cytochrome SoxX [Burkholderiaceae bacterium]